MRVADHDEVAHIAERSADESLLTPEYVISEMLCDS